MRKFPFSKIDWDSIPNENFLRLAKAIKECPKTAEQLDQKIAREQRRRNERN
jgi:hypothetical protein